MSADERQSYQESINREALRQDDPTTGAALAGAFVTPMPSQLCTHLSSSSASQGATAEQSGSCERKEQRAYTRPGSSENEVSQAPKLHGGSTWDGEQADASWQGNATAQATAAQSRTRKRGDNKTWRLKALQKAAIAGNQH